MGTVLLQAETKRSFAVHYVRCYSHLVTDFLKDDHDYGDSIISMSVQIFTVPTLVRACCYRVVSTPALNACLRCFSSTSLCPTAVFFYLSNE